MTITAGSSFAYIASDDFSDLDLIESFISTFPELDAVQTKEQILTMVSINNSVRQWYLEYKKFRSTFLEKPDWLPSDKEAVDDWAQLKDKLAGQKKLFRDWDARIESKSKALKAEYESVSLEKKSYFKTLNPLLVIHSFTVNNLPARDALEIALEGDLDLRARMIDDKVRSFKEKAYYSLKNGNFVNPYLK